MMFCISCGKKISELGWGEVPICVSCGESPCDICSLKSRIQGRASCSGCPSDSFAETMERNACKLNWLKEYYCWECGKKLDDKHRCPVHGKRGQRAFWVIKKLGSKGE